MARTGGSPHTGRRLEESRPLLGFLLLVAATAVLPVMDGMAKYLSQSYPLAQVVWARYFFHLIAMLPLVLWRYGPRALLPRRPAVQLLRGALLLAATMLFFAAISSMPLATALSLFFVSPLAVTLLAPLLLGETVGWRRGLAVLSGLGGVLIVIRPESTGLEVGALLALGAGIVHALYLIATRKLSGSAPPLVTLAYTAVVGAVVMSMVVPAYWQTPDSASLILMAAMGVLAAAGHLLVIHAFDFAPASVLAPAGYFEIVAATVVGFVVFGDFPDVWTWVGVLVIVASGVYVSLREQRQAARRLPELRR